MATPLVEVKHLKKYFDTPKGTLHAVDDVTFSIGRGKTMGVVGESGCGKSTLGRTIIHLYESTDGQILFDGEDVTRVNKKKMHQLREEMQIIFQDPFASLNPRMTVEDTIREPLELSRRFKKNELQDETDRIMEMVGIDERLRYAYPHELDGGRRQRVGIGRALAQPVAHLVGAQRLRAGQVQVRLHPAGQLLVEAGQAAGEDDDEQQPADQQPRPGMQAGHRLTQVHGRAP